MFGYDVADNVLISLQKPKWLIAAANMFVVIHDIGSCQESQFRRRMLLGSLLLGKDLEWFEKMVAFGVEPYDVTYAVMLDCYGRVGNMDMTLRLYDRSRTEK
ncbi:putative tetratricopeptide-like helical domain superfamily [Helianthus anomalus]